MIVALEGVHAMGDTARQRRSGMRGCLAAAALSCAVIASPARAEDDGTSAESCALEPGATRTVTRIIDGETLALDDGREVRLVGALGPRARDAGAEAGAWPLEEAAKTSLAQLTLGKRVELAYGPIREDRYGRYLAHVFVNENGRRLWVQGEMLQLGLARAYALPGVEACLATLIANEAIGRTVEAGIWTSRIYDPKTADKTFALLAMRGTFQIVRGRVQSVSQTKTAGYLNFGSDWKTDFTVRIPKRLLTAQPQLAALGGRTIEVRGWIERRNGPMLTITHAAAVSVLADEDAGAPLAAAPKSIAPRDASPAAESTAPSDNRAKENRPKRGAPGDVDL
jgi:endonuclease YncB( thermonuclease family)